MKTFSNIADELTQLDDLIIRGWSPCINNTKDGQWHVGMRHNHCPPCKRVTIQEADKLIITPVDQYSHVHVTTSTLKTSLIEAIRQVNLKVVAFENLIIHGVEGSGKTTLAQKLSVEYGVSNTTYFERLKQSFNYDIFANDPDVVIVDNCPMDDDSVALMKQLVTSDTLEVNRKYKPSSILKTPNFIFITGELEPLKIEHLERRFKLIECTVKNH